MAVVGFVLAKVEIRICYPENRSRAEDGLLLFAHHQFWQKKRALRLFFGFGYLGISTISLITIFERNVRFISINDNYDNFIHPLSVLELAFINLLNQDYLSDLVHKSASSRFTKVSRGEFVGRFAPFGYINSKTDKTTSLWTAKRRDISG